MDEKSEYEKQREKNIELNDAVLKALGLTGSFMASVKPTIKKERKKKDAETPFQKSRSSARLADLPARPYGECADELDALEYECEKRDRARLKSGRLSKPVLTFDHAMFKSMKTKKVTFSNKTSPSKLDSDNYEEWFKEEEERYGFTADTLAVAAGSSSNSLHGLQVENLKSLIMHRFTHDHLDRAGYPQDLLDKYDELLKTYVKPPNWLPNGSELEAFNILGYCGNQPRAICSGCGRGFVLKKDGTMRAHPPCKFA